MEENLKKQTKLGVFWSAIQRFSTQGLQFLITLVIARFLTPSDYGIIGMLGIFLSVASVFVDCGFTNALIRKQERNQHDCSTVFFFNIGIAVLSYLILFTAAPFVASFYNMPVLKNVLRVISLMLIINSFSAVQATLLTSQLDFKSQTQISIISISISGIIGITLAINGVTYWTLVVQGLVSSSISSFLYWRYSSWRPSLVFSRQSFKEMFSFGSKLLASSLIDSLYNNIYPIIIGKVYSASTLGNYSRAESYANFPSISITGILQRVTYPLLCKMQASEGQLAYTYRKMLKLSAFVIFPLMMGLSALARPFVVIIIGTQWEFCAVLLQILCFSLMWYPIQAINLSLLQVKGRTDLSLRLEIIKKIIGVIILCVSIPLGIVYVCYFRIVFSVICLFVNTYYTGKMIHVGIFKQLNDIMPTFLIAISMFALILFITNQIPNLYIQMIVGICVGSLFYALTSYLFNRDEFNTLLSLTKIN